MYIDTHAHLDFANFDSDREDLIRRSLQEGLEYVINVGSSFRGCLSSLDLARRYDIIYASIGIHPYDVKEINDDLFKQLEGLLRSDKVVAIGEVGLDFYRNLSAPDIQEKYFVKFLNLSKLFNLPVIIHSRNADKKTLELLKANSSGQLKGVVHCFSGSREFLDGCLELGLNISFTCNITYKGADNLRALAQAVPLDSLLLETDCPYLAPQNLRGKRNEPVNVKYLAQALAKIKGCSPDEIALRTTANAKRLFRLK